jgi:uncharacterized membrane protein YgaE (UPF0421/DUF939 family)
MSDIVLIQIIVGVVSLAGVGLSGFIAIKLAKVKTKVEEYHAEVNGNMHKLLKTTEELATAKEKARGKEEDKNK